MSSLVRTLRLAWALALIAACVACAGSNRPSGPVLRVGVSPDAPPVVFEREGEIVGIEADLARIAASALDRRLEFVRIPFPDLIDALEAGEIDVVMSGLAITPERSERVRFTVPYMESGQLAIIRTRDISRLGRVHTLRQAGMRVGFERATTGERFVADRLPRARSFAFESVEDGLRSLRAGRLDYFIHDAPTVWQLAGDLENRDLHGLYRLLTEEELAWALRPDDEHLASLLDATLRHWKREGLIEPIVQRWIPVRVTLR